MEIIDAWKQHNWQPGEFSYSREELRLALQSRSKSDITLLLGKYRKLYICVWAMTLATPLLILLKPGSPDFIFTLFLISLYGLSLSVFLTVKFMRFRLPDMSAQTVLSIQATLALVKSINRFQITATVYFTPLVFLGSMLGTLVYHGKSLRAIFSDPVIIAIAWITTLVVVLLREKLVRYASSKQCVAIIRRLEENLKQLTTEE